jgi:hypothetical protein
MLTKGKDVPVLVKDHTIYTHEEVNVQFNAYLTWAHVGG